MIGPVLSLQNFDGLGALDRVQGDLSFKYLHNLHEPLILPNITTISGTFWFWGASVPTVELPKLTHVGGDVKFGWLVYIYPKQTSAVAITHLHFPNLVEIGGTFQVEDMNKLVSLSFPLLQFVDKLWIRYAADLTTLSTPSLVKVNSLQFYNPITLFTGLSSALLGPMDSVDLLWTGPDLGLSNVTSTNKLYLFGTSQDLSSLESAGVLEMGSIPQAHFTFPKLKSATRIVIRDSIEFISLNMPQLVYVDEYIIVRYSEMRFLNIFNPGLFVNGYVQLKEMQYVSTLNFSSSVTIMGYLELLDNKNLQSLLFDNVTINGALKISGSPLLCCDSIERLMNASSATSLVTSDCTSNCSTCLYPNGDVAAQTICRNCPLTHECAECTGNYDVQSDSGPEAVELSQCEVAQGRVSMEDSDMIEHVNFLQTIRRIEGTLRLANLPNLTNTSGLSFIEEIDQSLFLIGALNTDTYDTSESLTTYQFNSLSYVGADLSVEDHQSASLISLFPALETVGNSLMITSNCALENVFFPKLRSVSYIYFTGNPSLLTINIPSISTLTRFSLQSPPKGCAVSRNHDSLISLNIQAQALTAGMTISDAPSLSNLTSLTPLFTGATNVGSQYQSSQLVLRRVGITNLDFLQYLQETDIQIVISDMPMLSSAVFPRLERAYYIEISAIACQGVWFPKLHTINRLPVHNPGCGKVISMPRISSIDYLYINEADDLKLLALNNTAILSTGRFDARAPNLERIIFPKQWSITNNLYNYADSLCCADTDRLSAIADETPTSSAILASSCLNSSCSDCLGIFNGPHLYNACGYCVDAVVETAQPGTCDCDGAFDTSGSLCGKCLSFGFGCGRCNESMGCKPVPGCVDEGFWWFNSLLNKGLCIDPCPNGQWGSVAAGRTCQPCSDFDSDLACSLCTDAGCAPLTGCSGYTWQGLCQSTCPPATTPSASGVCLPCSTFGDNCTICTEEDGCLIQGCPFLMSPTSSQYFCVDECLLNQYQNGSYCYPCDPAWAAPSFPSTCTRCTLEEGCLATHCPGPITSGAPPRYCASQCEPDEYELASNRTCQPCHDWGDGCLTCTESVGCQSCSSMLSNFGNPRYCLETCPIGQFNLTGVCMFCHYFDDGGNGDECVACSEQAGCEECDPLFYLTRHPLGGVFPEYDSPWDEPGQSHCVTSCLTIPPEYPSNDGWCHSCRDFSNGTSECTACSTEAQGCTACPGLLSPPPSPYYCLQECPMHAYEKSTDDCGWCQDDFADGGATCTACNLANGCDPSACDGILRGGAPWVCWPECVVNQEYHNNTRYCHDCEKTGTCTECSVVSGDCLHCAPGDEIVGKGCSDCPIDEWSSGGTSQCQPCQLVANSTGNGTCTVCTRETGQCVVSLCQQGSYPSSSGKCDSCPPPEGDGVCTQCRQSAPLGDCEDGFCHTASYKVIEESVMKCLACSAFELNGQTCSECSDTGCTSDGCAGGVITAASVGMCTDSCPNGQFKLTESNLCEKCYNDYGDDCADCDPLSGCSLTGCSTVLSSAKPRSCLSSCPVGQTASSDRICQAKSTDTQPDSADEFISNLTAGEPTAVMTVGIPAGLVLLFVAAIIIGMTIMFKRQHNLKAQLKTDRRRAHSTTPFSSPYADATPNLDSTIMINTEQESAGDTQMDEIQGETLADLIDDDGKGESWESV